MNVILMGPQGSGKGTQAGRIGPRLGLTQIATGELFRAAIAAETELGRRIKALYDRGELIPDELTVGLVAEKLDGVDGERSLGEAVGGALFDGFPRNREQAEALDETLARRGQAVTAVVRIDVPLETLVARLAGRRVCKRCGAVYHVAFNPTTREGVCDRCGGEVVQREDDTPAAVTKRLEIYFDQTAPLLGFYEGRGLLAAVDGDRPIEAVTDGIEAAIARLAKTGSATSADPVAGRLGESG